MNERKIERKQEQKQIMLVKMKRGTTVANVHPEEVDNYKKGGYVLIEAGRK